MTLILYNYFYKIIIMSTSNEDELESSPDVDLPSVQDVVDRMEEPCDWDLIK